jgi:hypothetical protein
LFALVRISSLVVYLQVNEALLRVNELQKEGFAFSTKNIYGTVLENVYPETPGEKLLIQFSVLKIILQS